MSKKKQEEEFQNIIEALNELRQEDAEQWGLFFLGTQIYIGKTRVYASQDRARLRLQDYVGGGHLSGRDANTRSIVERLEESGMLEIRKIGDRSPKFPRNIDNVGKEQAKKFEQMLDASDSEMVNLAIVILQGIKSQ